MRIWGILAYLLFPVLVFAGESWFRRDADEISWILHLEDDRYVVESCDLSGRKTKTEGSFIDSAKVITFKDKVSATKASVVHGQRFLKKRFGDKLYLVEETREKEFIEASESESRFIRELGLANFFHESPKPKPEKKEANQQPDPRRMDDCQAY